MRKSALLIASLLVVCISLSAQPKEVRVEIERSFAQYQNAFNNGNHAIKTIINAVKTSSSVKGAQAFAAGAAKYAGDASLYAEQAGAATQEIVDAIAIYRCSGTPIQLKKMHQQFNQAHQDFNMARAVLTDGSMNADGVEMMDVYQQAIEYLQAGVKKLNEGVTQMNLAVSEMRGCESLAGSD